ncbi:MAG: 2OG-Fe(II) oxygenase [Campylobacterales bacterium]|nr:2OG-Fe(II) oxygenase [Campylobacterales bacterium]
MHKMLYEKITDALVKDGYIVIDDAFDRYMATELFKYVKGESEFKRAGISTGNELHIDGDRRRDKINWLDEDDGIQSKFLDFAKGLQEYLNRELFLCLSYYEAHFAIYENGAFYEKHLDCFKNFKNRVVTTVFYMNENWSDGDGGELIVYDENDKFLKKVEPLFNTLVVFLSEKFPHEVLKANAKRYSIAGWFRVDKIGA